MANVQANNICNTNSWLQHTYISWFFVTYQKTKSYTNHLEECHSKYKNQSDIHKIKYSCILQKISTLFNTHITLRLQLS